VPVEMMEAVRGVSAYLKEKKGTPAG